MFICISACASLDIPSRPQATVERFAIDSISLRDITFLVDIGIINPYPVGLKLDDVKLVFYVEGRQLFKSDTKKGLRIRASAKETTSFKVNLKYDDIMNVVQQYTEREYLNCQADITIVIPLPKLPGIMEKNLSFNYKKDIKIPAIKPTVKIANFKVHMPSMNEIEQALEKAKKDALDSKLVFNMFSDMLSGKNPSRIINPDDLDLKLKVDFDIELKNGTRAKLLFNEVAYDFSVNNSKLVVGNTDQIINNPSGTIIKVSNTFSTRALSSSIIDSFRKKHGNFTLKGQTSVTLPAVITSSPLKLTFDEAGAFNL